MQFGRLIPHALKGLSLVCATSVVGMFIADDAFAQANEDLASWTYQLATYWRKFETWIVQEYSEAPALVIAGGVAVFAPLLAILGVALHSLFSRRARPMDTTPRTKPLRALQTRATLEVVDEDDRSEQFWVGHGLVRIGREEDNDVQLVHKTVHRYHAVIERTPESEFFISDVSGADGNGVRVNGERIQRHRLRGGELIDIGQSRLKFALSES